MIDPTGAPTPSAPVPVLEVRGLTREFTAGGASGRRGRIAAVDNVSFALPGRPAQIISLVGESGSGKTTLARMMLGLARASSGEVLFHGKNIDTLSREQFADFRRQVQPVFQDPYGIYNPFYRIERVLELAIRNFALATSRDETRARMEEALKAVDLRPADIIGRYPHQLSGGERQRVMLARLFLLRPRLIIADEPVSMIDAAVRTLFLNILLDFRDSYGISCLFITHNLSTAYYLGGRIMVMCFGRVVESGDVDAVIAEPVHPYTRQLLKSVPSVDPEHRWTTRIDIRTVERPLTHESSMCCFVERCPSRTPACSQRRPPDVDIGGGRAVACLCGREAPGSE